jgi:hypothetical protein
MEDQKHIENLSHAKHPRTFITKINIGIPCFGMPKDFFMAPRTINASYNYNL